MNHFWTVFEREYLHIVKKKAFWLSTLLLPVGLLLLFGIQIASMLLSSPTDTTVWVLGRESSPVIANWTSGEGIRYQFSNMHLDSAKAHLKTHKNDIAIQLPDSFLLTKKEIALPVYHGSGSVNEQVLRELKKHLKNAIYDYKRKQAGIEEQRLSQLDFNLDVNTQRVTEAGSQQSSMAMAYGVGFAMNFLMYMLVAIYGSMMMQSVIEEKNNRIVEIILSSIEPFKLLMGKILAVAVAGITQFLLWILLSGVVVFVSSLVIGFSLSPEDLAVNTQTSGMDNAQAQELAHEISIGLQNFNWHILWLFPVYFVGGFLLFGSLYAALGSAVDNVQDAQQFAMPLTFLAMLPILFVSYILNNPTAPFSVFCSLFPFFSPMVMMTRLALTEVPLYQVALSIILLIGSFVGGIWISGKIYRTGILMYGKKPSVKELLKWIRYS